jgi:hypothetical protein
MAYQWQLNGRAIDGATNATWAITNATLNDMGQYSVIVTGPTGSVTSLAPPLVVDPTFSKITTGPIVTEGAYVETCSWGDLDGDGRIDLFAARSNGALGDLMYQNLGGGLFVKVTNAVTRAGGTSIGSAWADYDNNGTLDLLVGTYGGGAVSCFATMAEGLSRVCRQAVSLYPPPFA